VLNPSLRARTLQQSVVVVGMSDRQALPCEGAATAHCSDATAAIAAAGSSQAGAAQAGTLATDAAAAARTASPPEEGGSSVPARVGVKSASPERAAAAAEFVEQVAGEAGVLCQVVGGDEVCSAVAAAAVDSEAGGGDVAEQDHTVCYAVLEPGDYVP
jgi:hypothetical protein